MITVVCPRSAHPAYGVAAREFARLYSEITGRRAVFADDDAVPEEGDLAVIGSDSVNAFAAKRMLDGEVEFSPLKYGGDGYAVLSRTEGGRRVLYFASGRGRSAIYAVYRYFEKFCGCAYFWDGDTVPAADDIVWENVSLHEEPRFEYRGIRYFAHRSLHRFQAEMWDEDDWKREIDWLLKKGLNLFMLRIGLDDLFQKAFPDIVSYPSAVGRLPEAGSGFDDRTLFWPLEYRGSLRKRVLRYAFERDLMHPEDCGTMTHWYSRTPIEFLEKKKLRLLSQSSGIYAEQTGLVWDISDNENLENYFRLTDTHIREYGQPGLFHTIGLAERTYSDDREANLRLKKFVYRRICRHIAEKYPESKLLLASWDLYFTYTNDEVRRLIPELDPSQVVLLDYTSDSQTSNSVANWDVIGRFPWICGIFHSYEPNSEIRNDYAFIERMLSRAKADGFCKGLVFWPELSHSDTFMLEFFAENARSDRVISASEIADGFCKKRYGARSGLMRPVWDAMLAIAADSVWSADEGEKLKTELFFNVFDHFAFDEKSRADMYDALIGRLERSLDREREILPALERLDLSDARVERDVFDIRRTLLGRRISLVLLKLRRECLSGGETAILCAECIKLTESLAELLGRHDDFSLSASLERLRAAAPVNPVFERTLKENADNPYCRSYIYELVREVYLPEMRLLFSNIAENGGRRDHRADCRERAQEINRAFLDKPLSEMR